MPTVAVALAATLAGAGVRHAYTVPGESFLGLLDALDQQSEIDLVSTRHESGAAFMADASARLTGVPAVALGSRGPGASNLAIGVHTAMQDATPMVVVLGQVRTDFLGREAFQEVDLAAMYAPLAKWTGSASTPQDSVLLLEEALRQAVSGRPGPAVLVLPTDLVDATVPAGDATFGTPQLPFSAGEPASVHTDTLRALADRLTNALRPVLVVGRGVAAADPAVISAAERFGLGVYVAFRCQDRFPVEHPQFLGHLGLAVPKEILREIRESDLVVALGTRWDEVTSQSYTLPPVDADQVSLGRFDPGPAVSWLDGDAGVLLGQLLTFAPDDPSGRDWGEGHAAADVWSMLDEDDQPQGGELLHPAYAVRALHRVTPADAIVASDAGNFAAFLHRYWRFGPGVRQLAPASGAMGFAVPAAVAAAQAAPDRPVVALVGDGGALMTGQEIETAVRLGADVVIVVFQNSMYGTIAMHQVREVGRTTAVAIGDVDFAAWAQGLGAALVRTVTAESDLETALKDAFAHRGPALVAVRTDPDVISPTARLSGLAAAHRSSPGR